MSKKIFGLAMAVILVLTAAGCNKAKKTAEEQKPLRFALAVKNLTNPYFVELARGAQEACNKYGITLEVQATSADTEIDKQVQICDNFLITHPDAILVTPLSSTAIIPFVKRCNDVGVPFVNCDGQIDETELKKIGATVLTTVAADNITAGEEGARALIKHLSNKGKIAVLEGTSGVATAEDRKKGFESIMAAEGSGIVISASQPANYNRNRGYEVSQAILAANPDIKGIFAANAEMALGAVKAVEEAGKINQIAIVGVYNSDEAKQATLAGKMLGSAHQDPYEIGWLAAEKAYEYITKGTQPEYLVKTPSVMLYAKDMQ